MNKSKYISASGHEVTLYKGPNGFVTVIQGQVIAYDRNGEMGPDYGTLEAALKSIGLLVAA